MQEHARASGLLWPFQCKGCFRPTPIPVPAYIFWTLYDLIIPYNSFSELFTVILVGVCAQHRALVGAQHCPTLTWYEKVWASCTLILCKKGALDCLPRGTATVGVGCSKGSNTDCLQASSNIFKPASYDFRILNYCIWWWSVQRQSRLIAS